MLPLNLYFPRFEKADEVHESATEDYIEKRLGFFLHDIKVVEMLDSMNCQPAPSITKNIAVFVRIEGYPGQEAIKEVSINDLVYSILFPIIDDVKKTVRKNLILFREKNITSVDSETGGREDFVTMDYISISDKRFVLVVEAKKSDITLNVY